jgi:RNA polymerase sigma-70 factor, ECF subfamily
MEALNQKPDIELINDFKSGNEPAFNELVKRYHNRLYFIVKKMVENHDDADDILQDVFIKVYKSLRDFRGESNFYTWLYRIAVNYSINFLNKKKIKNFFRYDDLIRPMVSNEPIPDEILEKHEQSAMIEKAIQSLPKMQKMTFIMRYYDEMPYEEISKILKKSVGALKANYFHAFKKIEEYMKNEMQRN